MQLFNVYQGGTLIFDIPTVTKLVGHGSVQSIPLTKFICASYQEKRSNNAFDLSSTRKNF